MVSSVDVSINLNDNTSFSIESFESKLPNFQYSTSYLERLYNKLDSKSCDDSGITQNQ